MLLQTLWLCARVTLICLLLAFPIAWFVWRQAPARRYLLLLLIVLPLFMSYIVKLYTMRSILGLNGLLNQMLLGLGILERPTTALLYNQTAILATLAVLFLPFVVLPVFLSLERVPASLLQASADLGASPLATFRHVSCRWRCPAPSPARCSPSCCRWAITSRRRWSAAPPASPMAG